MAAPRSPVHLPTHREARFIQPALYSPSRPKIQLWPNLPLPYPAHHVAGVVIRTKANTQKECISIEEYSRDPIDVDSTYNRALKLKRKTSLHLRDSEKTVEKFDPEACDDGCTKNPFLHVRDIDSAPRRPGTPHPGHLAEYSYDDDDESVATGNPAVNVDEEDEEHNRLLAFAAYRAQNTGAVDGNMIVPETLGPYTTSFGQAASPATLEQRYPASLGASTSTAGSAAASSSSGTRERRVQKKRVPAATHSTYVASSFSSLPDDAIFGGF